MEFSRFGQRLGVHLAIGILLVSAGALGAGWGCGGGTKEQVIQYEGEQNVPSKTPAPSDTIQPPQGGTTGGTTGGDEIITPTTGGTTTGGETTAGTTTGGSTTAGTGTAGTGGSGTATAGTTGGTKGAFDECISDTECGVDPTFGQLQCLSTVTVNGKAYPQAPGPRCLNQALADATIYALAVQCADGQKNGDETAVDCGGSCPLKYDYAFVSDRDGGAQNVYIQPCGGGTPKKVTANTDSTTGGPKYSWPVFRPGATQLAFHVEAAFFLIPIVTEQFADLTVEPPSLSWLDLDLDNDGHDDQFAKALTYNPDGQKIAYIYNTWIEEGIKRDPSDPSDASNLETIIPGTMTQIDKLVWSPVTDPSSPAYGHIIFSRKNAGSGSYQLSSYIFGQTSEWPVLDNYASSSGFPFPLEGRESALSPDGQKLAFVKKFVNNNKDQIWTCRLDFQPIAFFFGAKAGNCTDKTMWTSDGNNTQPCWSADGQSIYFTSDRDGHKQIYRMDSQTPSNEEDNVSNSSSNDSNPGCVPPGPPSP